MPGRREGNADNIDFLDAFTAHRSAVVASDANVGAVTQIIDLTKSESARRNIIAVLPKRNSGANCIRMTLYRSVDQAGINTYVPIERSEKLQPLEIFYFEGLYAGKYKLVLHLDYEGDSWDVHVATGAGPLSVLPTRDAGPISQNYNAFGESANATSTAIDCTPTPPTDMRVHVDDLVVSTDTDMRIDLYEQDAVAPFWKVYIAARVPTPLTLRNCLQLPTPGKKLQLKASVAGNITTFCTWKPVL